MIKESIGMAHRDLGNVYRDLRNYAASLKHRTKSREFCTTSQHVLDMCLSVLELLINQRNYSHLTAYIFKQPLPPPAVATAGVTAAGAAQQKKKAAARGEREGVQANLSLATALSYLGQGNYEKAATSLLNVGSPSNLVDWIGKLVAPGDITIYTTLCALATFPRASIKSRLLENTNFTLYMEHEATIRDIIQAYMNSNFKVVLELLNRYSTRHYIEVHLARHVHDLSNLIRNWGCSPLLPAIRDHTPGSDECGVWIDGRGG
ncbi:26S proteasome subunit RPN7-domain-containing protein [Coprinopsis sp. MPI-PUGE-AT-0042]|nr:26S proteasome subunit RPN7-domain-containing protein [Coprinopsis sp. MPI-PUGE-AT-0042]